MLELPHALIGAMIATQVGDPLLALPLALGSHFAADYLPHWNPHLYRETEKYGKPTKKSTIIVIVDSVLAFLVCGFIALRALPDTRRFLVILGAIFLAVIPDVLEAPFYYLGIKPDWIVRLIAWQRKHQLNTSVVPGILLQTVVVAACLYVIFR